MIFSHDEWPGGNNLMHTPAAWRDVFGYLDGDTLGLNLDPSHLVWQMIDYERVVREFGDRLYHVHAKDMEIDRDGLYDRGVLSAGHGVAGAAAARARRGALGPLHQRAVQGGLRLRGRRRARGPSVRGQRREGQGRVPASPATRCRPTSSDRRSDHAVDELLRRRILEDQLATAVGQVLLLDDDQTVLGARWPCRSARWHRRASRARLGSHCRLVAERKHASITALTT